MYIYLNFCFIFIGFNCFPGDRIFPPQTGLTYSTWVCVEKYSDRGTDLHCVRVLTLVRHVPGRDHHLVCLSVVISARDKALIVSTHETNFPQSGQGKSWSVHFSLCENVMIVLNGNIHFILTVLYFPSRCNRMGAWSSWWLWMSRLVSRSINWGTVASPDYLTKSFSAQKFIPQYLHWWPTCYSKKASLHFAKPWWWGCKPHHCFICICLHWNSSSI